MRLRCQQSGRVTGARRACRMVIASAIVIAGTILSGRIGLNDADASSAMIKVDIQGVEFVKAHLAGMGKQVAFAASKALNATGKAVAEAMPVEIERALDKPTTFTKRGVRVLTYANKAKLEATVGFMKAQAEYMRWQVEGGVRQPGSAGLRLPSAIKVNEFGNIPRGIINQLIAVARKEGKLGKVKARRVQVSSKVELSDGAPPMVLSYSPPVFKPTPVKHRTWMTPTPWKATFECVHHEYGKPSNRWQYLNDSGKLIGYVARYDVSGGRKQFCPWIFNGSDWASKKWPSYQPLYGMDIMAARPHDPILVVEGEKACDAARRICGEEYVCITWPGGANAYDGPDWSMVTGRNVLLWPDADKPGVMAMDKLKELIGDIVANIAVLDVSRFPEKWDAADALADGWVPGRFNQLVEEQFSGSKSPESVTPMKIVEVKDSPEPQRKPSDLPSGILQVPGILGKIVEWSMHSARKPQPIYSVAAAIALGSVLMGRRYRTTMNNWASLYLISIGRSATGKEHIKTTVEEVLEAAGLDALLGPSKYTSESGVMSALIDKPTHIHITDELGMQLESANKDKGSAYRDISKIEMECFGRLHGTLHPVGYSTAGMTQAQKSELASRKVKNPALTIMAMTTPDTFYDAIGSKSLRDGFLNRFIIMECHAEREPGQVCKPVEVPADAIEWCRRVREPASPLSGLIDVSHDIEPQPRTMEFEPQSMSAFRDFEDFTLNEMNRLDKYGLAEMWGRASEISMRLSMIIAKSCDSDLIKKEHADWSIAFVRYFTTEMVSLSGINITENSFDAAVQDVMSRVKEAGASGMTRKQMRESSRKFKSLTYSGQNDVVRLLLEDGEFLAVERRKVRGPASTAFIHCDHFEG